MQKQNSIINHSKSNWTDLPPEILLKIFTLCKNDDNCLCLYNLCQVCKQWSEIALDYVLWNIVDDINLNAHALQELAILGAFTKTKTLHIYHLNQLGQAIVFFLRQCRELKHLKLSSSQPCYIKNLNSFSILPNLKEIEFGENVYLSFPSFENFLQFKGKWLTTLSLLDANLDKTTSEIEIIARYCPNLKVFRFKGKDEVFIPIGALEKDCPKLNELNLTIYGFDDVNEVGNGFPCLEKLYFSSFRRYSFHDLELSRLTSASSRLKLLSLFDCNVSCSLLCNLPIANLETLELSYCSIDPPSGLGHVLMKLKRGLKHLKIEYVYVEDGDVVDYLKPFIEDGGGKSLEVLKLPSENSSTKVLAIVRTCPNLHCLHLLDVHCKSQKEIEKWLSFQ